MAQKLLLFWRKPARRCWWEGVELENVDGVEGKLKVWIRRVWTLEMVSHLLFTASFASFVTRELLLTECRALSGFDDDSWLVRGGDEHGPLKRGQGKARVYFSTTLHKYPSCERTSALKSCLSRTFIMHRPQYRSSIPFLSRDSDCPFPLI